MTQQLFAILSTPEQIDLLSELFFSFGAQAVTLTDAKDQPIFQINPENYPHWNHTIVQGLFLEERNLKNIIEAIKTQHLEFSKTEFFIEKTEEKDWVAETQKYFSPQQFKRLWVCPAWEKEKFSKENPNTLTVFIEPGIAFGTGAHPTTQLCLQWLSNHFTEKNGADLQCIDYGCGSGILALAASALGVGKVIATDHDAQALEATQNNFQYNAFKDSQLIICNTTEIKNYKADVVIANILSNTLIDLASTLQGLLKPNGKLVLSGILTEDIPRVLAAYPTHTQPNVQALNEWALIEMGE